MQSPHKPVYLQDAVAYSAVGNTVLDVFAAIDTYLLQAEQMELPEKSGTANCYQLKISDLAATKFQTRIRLLVKGLLHNLLSCVADNYTKLNTHVWLQLPANDHKRSTYINTEQLMPILCDQNSPLQQFEFYSCTQQDGFRLAVEYLHQRQDIQRLIFLAIDSLIDVEAENNVILGEAAIALILTREKVGGMAVTINTSLEQNQQSLQKLAQQKIDKVIRVQPETDTVVASDYQIEQTYMQQPFSLLPKKLHVHKVNTCQFTGDLGAVNVAMGLMYCMGYLQYNQAANEALIMKQNDNDTLQTIVAQRCI